MTGKPAVLRSLYGRGNVIALSPHFESTKGKESVVLNAIKQVAAATAANEPTMAFPEPSQGLSSAPFRCDVSAEPIANRPNEFEIKVQMQIGPGWHAYANVAPGSPYQPIAPQLQLPKQVEAIGHWNKPLAMPDLKNPQQMRYTGMIVFTHKVRQQPSAKSNQIDIQIQYQVCDEQKCLPPATIKKSVSLNQ